ncbi:unnamed protein product [Diamesa serratosioi]
MGSIQECRLEGFICRLCSLLDRNVIHIYTEEGLKKKLEQKINVYLKINLTRFDPLPKTICIPCDLKLEQHHRFIQRVIQNQKKIVNRPIVPLIRDIPTVATDDDNTENDEQTESDESEVEDIDYRAIFANRNGGLYNRRRENNEQ